MGKKILIVLLMLLVIGISGYAFYYKVFLDSKADTKLTYEIVDGILGVELRDTIQTGYMVVEKDEDFYVVVINKDVDKVAIEENNVHIYVKEKVAETYTYIRLNKTPSEITVEDIDSAYEYSEIETYQGFPLIGHIEIPAINLKYPILEENTNEALEIGTTIFSLDNVILELNKPGNVVIMGNNNEEGKFFSNLKDLAVGDTIIIENVYGEKLSYTIYESFETTSPNIRFTNRLISDGTEITLVSPLINNEEKRTVIYAKAECEIVTGNLLCSLLTDQRGYIEYQGEGAFFIIITLGEQGWGTNLLVKEINIDEENNVHIYVKTTRLHKATEPLGITHPRKTIKLNNTPKKIIIEDINDGYLFEKIDEYYNFPVVGFIEMPELKLNYTLLQTWRENAIDASLIVSYPDNAGYQVNKPGNIVIMGHNEKDGKFFSNLKDLSIGDNIIIEDLSGEKMLYTVYEIYETTPEDNSYVSRDTNSKTEITLVTDTDDGQKRLIVLARPE